MLGSRSCSKTYLSIEVDRFGVTVGEAIFMIVLPKNATLKDILLYRPYTPAETLEVKIYDNDSNLKATYNLLTNRIKPINLRVGELVTCSVKSETVKKIFVFYEM